VTHSIATSSSGVEPATASESAPVTTTMPPQVTVCDGRAPWPPGSLLAGLTEPARQRLLALGAKCQYTDSGRVLISTQNHGFAVDESTLPATLRATHRSLFDGSLQGLTRTDRPAFSFQGHPEASPGPHDLRLLFEHFLYLMVKRMQANSRGRTPVKQKSAES